MFPVSHIDKQSHECWETDGLKEYIYIYIYNPKKNNFKKIHETRQV